MAEAGGSPRGIPVEEVARYPVPGTSVPAGYRFGGVGLRWLTWLQSPERSLRRDLYALDLDGGADAHPYVVEPPGGGVSEENLSLEERLRRERARDLGQGVTSFAWARDGERLMVPLPGGVWTREGLDRPWVCVASPDELGPVLDAQLSPDGSQVAFVKGDEVYVVEADGSAPPVQLTTGARGTGRTHGLAEFVAQEEMDRSHGFWWSPDGRWIAYTEVDETHIPVYRIVHQGADAVGEGAYEDHRYPFAGADNARVRLRVVASGGGDPVACDLGDAEYLTSVMWLSDGGLVAAVEDRPQAQLELLRFDPAVGGPGVSLLVERSEVWINLHHCFRRLPEGRFLWASERTGFMHLEVRDSDGALVRVLTEGEWLVTSVEAVDDERAEVWFTSTEASALERQLCVVGLDGGPPRRLTGGAGVHGVCVNAERRLFVDVHSSASAQPTCVLRHLDDGAPTRVLFDDPDPRVAAVGGGLAPPELTVVEVADGVPIHVAVWRPDGPPPWPTVVSVYGGPHAQQVTNSWGLTARMRAQYLRGLGFLVVQADNRGSANRGLAFEGAIRWNAGDVEVADQVAVVQAMVERGLADPARVGIYGWSYGGYMAAMCLARAPETFHAAVAGAPVTHWDGYDTFYTERYMGTPASNPEGYERSSVMAHAAGITGALMLVHGLIDENVHFRHTARLINALVRARVPYELLLYPNERHSPRSEADRVHMEEQIRDFLVAHLLA